MSSAFSAKTYPEFYASMQNLLQKVSNPFLLLFIGLALTALVQSSTAVTALTLSMSGFFLGMGNAVYFIIIGSNIGTCVTALISALGASPNAKRAAVIHFLFNFFGAIIFTVVLVLWKGFADTVLVTLFRDNPAMQIALFHTLFNVVCTLIFLPFIGMFVKLANLIVRDKKKDDTERTSREALVAELDERLLRSPSVALGYLYQETGKIFTYAMNALALSVDAFLNKDLTAKEKVLGMNAELAQVNRLEVSYIMRIGELADNVTKYTGHYVNDGLVFSGEFLEMIREMYGKIEKLYVLSLATYLYKDFAKLEDVDRLEDEIDRDRKKLVARHIARLNEGKCQPQNSNVFINLVGNLERAADHITYIAHSIE